MPAFNVTSFMGIALYLGSRTFIQIIRLTQICKGALKFLNVTQNHFQIVGFSFIIKLQIWCSSDESFGSFLRDF